MDSLTHFALGACMGEAFAGKTLGKKAMLWGALLQSLPDFDFLAAFWMDPASNMLAHRGFTHSLLFCLIITPLIAMLAERLHRPHNIRFLRWSLFVGGVILIHILIDAFNAYGVAWFEPFSHQRISFNTLYVVDPLFSIWAGISFIALLFTKQKNLSRRVWWRFGLVFSSLYLLYSVAIKFYTDNQVRHILQQKQIKYTRYFTTPAPLQNLLWYVVAGSDRGYYVGYFSVLDSEKVLDLHYFPRNDSLLNSINDHLEVHQLRRFSKGFYTVTNIADTLVFSDLRFGQKSGWYKPGNEFVFQYYLQHRSGNDLLLQRGRFSEWNIESGAALVRRIKGR